MILIVTGSGDFPFERLLSAVDECAPRFNERFVMQTAQCAFQARNCETIGVVPYGTLVGLYKEATVVVSHASAGPLIHTRRCNKPVVMLARRPELGEIIDDHQIQLAHAYMLEQEPMRSVIETIEELEPAIRRMQQMAHNGSRYRDSATGLISLQQAIRTYVGF